MKLKDDHLILIFCTIGCLGQLFSVSKQFVNFQVRSEIAFEYPRIVELPDIDIMIPMALAINLTELFIRYPNNMLALCQGLQLNQSLTVTDENFEILCPRLREAPVIVSHHISHFITVNDVEQLTVDAYKNIKELSLTERQRGLMIENLCKVDQFFSSIAVYLRLSCRNQSKPFMVDVRKYLVSGSSFGILSHSLGNYFGFRFASPRYPCEINPSRYFTVVKASGGLIMTAVRYKKTISLSLPTPFESHCKNYEKPSALWDCLLSRSTNKEENSYLPENVLISYGQYPGHLGFRENKEMSFCADVIDRPECKTVVYETEGNTFPEQINYDAGYIYLEPPLDPTVYYKTYPAFPLSDYIIFTGSILGIWFGVSIAERLSSGVKYLRTICKKKGYRKPLKRPNYLFYDNIYWMEKVKNFY